MVCKNEKTLELLETGELAKKLFLEQAKKAVETFYIQAIEIANECDYKYKTSQNQRLLVELCLMQLASINYDGEKKKGLNL